MLTFLLKSKKGLQVKWTPEYKKAFAQLKDYLSQQPQLGKLLYLYLTISMVIMSVILIQEEWHKQLPIYYVSHSMMLTKIRYSNVEKLTLTLL